MSQQLEKHYSDVVALLKRSGFEVEERKNLRMRARIDSLVNPADIRSKIAEVLSTAGYQGYYLKEAYAYMGSKKPWRTEDEGFVEIELWPTFTKVKEQAKVAKLNQAVVTSQTRITPLAQG